MSGVRLCVLVSGSGTILEAMLSRGLEVGVVAADRPCRGLEVARDAGVEAVLVDRASFGGFTGAFDRDGYCDELVRVLRQYGTELIAMAGFGTIVNAAFHAEFPGRVLNTHPSLLPDFKGWHAVAQAIESGVDESGCTVHVATLELDDGPILAQRRVPVLSGDDESSLHERIKSVEREVYPMVVGRVMAAIADGVEPESVAETREGE